MRPYAGHKTEASMNGAVRSAFGRSPDAAAEARSAASMISDQPPPEPAEHAGTPTTPPPAGGGGVTTPRPLTVSFHHRRRTRSAGGVLSRAASEATHAVSDLDPALLFGRSVPPGLTLLAPRPCSTDAAPSRPEVAGASPAPAFHVVGASAGAPTTSTPLPAKRNTWHTQPQSSGVALIPQEGT